MPAPEGNQNALKNYVGMRFGWLTVVEHMGWVAGYGGGQRRPFLKLRCDCGKEVTRRRDTLVKTSSCGCKHGESIKGNTNHRGSVKPELAATERPTLNDIAWAAGIYEGEGSAVGSLFTRYDGTTIKMLAATVCQVDPWLINRLRALFGGTVAVRKNNRSKRPNEQDIWVWTVTGSRARGFYMTIWQFLSPRRHEQILSNGYSFREP